MRGIDLFAVNGDRPAVSMLTRRTRSRSRSAEASSCRTSRAAVRASTRSARTRPSTSICATTEPERVAALYAILDGELGDSVNVESMHATASQLDDATRKQLHALGLHRLRPVTRWHVTSS